MKLRRRENFDIESECVAVNLAKRSIAANVNGSNS